jgi:signal transduction histidine kinase
LRAALDERERTGRFHGELTLLRRDGSKFLAELSSAVFRDQEGEVRTSMVIRDITERKRAEEALRQLSGRFLQMQDEERRRLARDLHDTVAQGLAALSLNLGLLQSSATALNPRSNQLLADSQALADQCANEVRTSSYLLHPPILDELGLAGAVRDHAAGFAHRTGLRVDLELPPDLVRLPRETELALFRVLQEALANIQRHSGSKTASIRVAQTADDIRLEVRDKGRGMAPERGLPARF